MDRVNELYGAAQDVQRFLNEEGWSHCLVGGVAVIRWGNPRQTTDFDLCVFAGWEDPEPVIASLCSRYLTRGKNAEEFARRNRVLLLTSKPGGVTFDVSLGALPFEEEMISRASNFQYAPSISLRTCSAEDLVVMKCFAGRDIDRHDVRGILARQRGKLDTAYIRRWLGEIQEGLDRSDPLETFERMLRES